MRKLLWLLLITPLLAFGDIVVAMNDVVCLTGQNANCSNPAPGYTQLTFNAYYGRLTLTRADGTRFDSGQYAANSDGGIVIAPDGTMLKVATTYAIWLTRVTSGRGQGYVEHWELKEGSIAPYPSSP